ncbi:hypothetical protein SLEP1_g1938 [Rubroshorea leprosula]|uniref:Protein kinase domain-containing protein n=1 Tax=Rubroshorea leprosula TaxID=152421 RepID=A0AAV5HJX8_9ROSI|nr:hypothetical protein SLEP1_g1938 [Rubroshorea leprosula]
MKQHSRILLSTIISLLCLVGASWGATEAEILIKFKNSMSSVASLNGWDESVSPFNGNSSNLTGLCCTQPTFGRRISPCKPGSAKLHFGRNGRESFELPDLLRASAEVLGSGGFGSSYKTLLLGGHAIVVKRLQRMNIVGKEEFREHMRRLGQLSHPNLLLLVPFKHKKEEKLLVSDYAQNGSLASHRHGRRTPEKPGLDWPTRLRIIKGVARGLAYLYQELPKTLALPHGHLKSSNVVLDGEFEPLLTDYALVPVVNRDHAQQFMVAFKSPEFTQYDRTTRKTDVWSLGILILELLTGKFPANYLIQGKAVPANYLIQGRVLTQICRHG